MKKAKSMSYPTGYTLSPPPAKADISELATDEDSRWVSFSIPYHPKSFTRVQVHLEYAMLRVAASQHYICYILNRRLHSYVQPEQKCPPVLPPSPSSEENFSIHPHLI